MPDRTYLWDRFSEPQPAVIMTHIPDALRVIDLATERIIKWDSLLGEWVPASDIKYVEVETPEESERNAHEEIHAGE